MPLQQRKFSSLCSDISSWFPSVLSGLSGTCGTRDAGEVGLTVAELICSLCWLDEESCPQCYSLSRCPCKKQSCRQPVVWYMCRCGFQMLKMKGWCPRHCFSYASISSPAVDEMWKKIDHHPFDLLTILIMLWFALSAWLNNPQLLRDMNCIWKSFIQRKQI